MRWWSNSWIRRDPLHTWKNSPPPPLVWIRKRRLLPVRSNRHPSVRFWESKIMWQIIYFSWIKIHRFVFWMGCWIVHWRQYTRSRRVVAHGVGWRWWRRLRRGWGCRRWVSGCAWVGTSTHLKMLVVGEERTEVMGVATINSFNQQSSLRRLRQNYKSLGIWTTIISFPVAIFECTIGGGGWYIATLSTSKHKYQFRKHTLSGTVQQHMSPWDPHVHDSTTQCEVVIRWLRDLRQPNTFATIETSPTDWVRLLPPQPKTLAPDNPVIRINYYIWVNPTILNWCDPEWIND